MQHTGQHKLGMSRQLKIGIQRHLVLLNWHHQIGINRQLKSVMLLSGVELETLGEIPGMDLVLPVLIEEEFSFIARFKGLIQTIILKGKKCPL